MLVPVRLGHEHLDVVAEDVAARMAEEALGRRIHRLDLAALVDGDDGIDGGIKDRAGAGLTLEEGLLCRRSLDLLWHRGLRLRRAVQTRLGAARSRGIWYR